MLLDRKHTPWFLFAVTASVVAIVIHRLLGPGLTGGSAAGLWFGVLGSLLMLVVGFMLRLHRGLMTLQSLPVRRFLGKRSRWLRAHIWLSVVAFVLILCHAGWRVGGGPLEIALWLVVALTYGSGVVGLVVQGVLPRYLTDRLDREGPYEQIPAICEAMRRETDETVAKLPDGHELRRLHEREVRPFLAAAYDRSAALADPDKAELLFLRAGALPGMDAHAETLKRFQTMCEERRQLGEQERLHVWLHGWLLVHIPITVVLLVLGTFHAVMSVYW